MENVNANQPPPPLAWRDRSPLNLTPLLHAMPHNFDKSLPKFEPNEGIFVDDHLQSFYLALEGLQVVDERVCQYIDIVVADIPDAYGLVLSHHWSEKLDGYFASNWSHFWFPYKGFQNQIKVLREPQMKHNVS